MAFACECFGPSPPSKAFDESTAVFTGRVASVETVEHNKKVHFDVERAWKGVTETTATVSTGIDSGACGYDFEEGREYLVYAYGSNELLGSGICTRTQPVMDAYVDLAALGPGYIPVQSAPQVRDVTNMGLLVLGAVACAAIIGVVAFMMVRQWRRK